MYDQAGSATSSKDCLRYVDGRDYNFCRIIHRFGGKKCFMKLYGTKFAVNGEAKGF